MASTDVFGLNQYQENQRAIHILVEVNHSLLRWGQHVQDLMTLTQTEHLTFAHTNDLMKKLMTDVNGLLLTSQREKRQFRDQCKLVQECIKLPEEATAAPSPPEPPKADVLVKGKRKLDREEVLDEGKRTSLHERRRGKKALRLNKLKAKKPESRPEPPPTPCVEGPDPLQHLLEQEGWLEG